MTLIRLRSDELGAHPFASASWLAQGWWRSTVRSAPEALDGGLPIVEALALVVPPEVQRTVQSDSVRATVRWLPWRNSGLGLLAMVAADDLVFAALDVAGRADLVSWHDGNVFTQCLAGTDGDFRRFVRIGGLAQTIHAAGAARRLRGSEFMEAIADLRGVLRTGRLFDLVPKASRYWRSLTLNVCLPPPRGRRLVIDEDTAVR